jgi:hypothetical protein
MVYLENACIGNIHDTSYKTAFYNDVDGGSIYLSAFKAFRSCSEREYLKIPDLFCLHKSSIIFSVCVCVCV